VEPKVQNVTAVSPVYLQAIHKLTDYLSYQVRLVAQELVDAFDLPDLIIRAPIGMQSEAYAQYTQYVGF
jgi:acyl-CoA oxidase